MDQVANVVGTYWFKDKATKELTSVGNDINSSLTNSIEGGTKWLVNKVKGKVQKPLAEFLKENDLPIGLFPRDATNYEYNEQTKKLVVNMSEVCEVGYKDSSVLRFDKTVRAVLVERGRLAEIEGIKTKMLIWIRVTNIASEGPSKLHVTAGLRKTRSREAYEVSRHGVVVDKF